MSDTRTPSAEKILIARSRDGEEWELHVKVWPPRPSSIAPWSCKVEVTRLFTPAKDICGEDSWQAQYLAMRFATSLLEHFVEQGGTLYWPEVGPEKHKEQFSVKDLLPHRGE